MTKRLVCPWCKKQLKSYDRGVMCESCLHYFEDDKWLRVACDEYHAHGKKCLVEIKEV